MPTSNVLNTDALLRGYLAAYVAKDLAAVASMLAEGVRLQDWNLAAHGRDAVLHETHKNFQAANSLAIDVLDVFASSTKAVAQLRIVVNGEVELAVVDVLSFAASGLITEIRAYKG